VGYRASQLHCYYPCLVDCVSFVKQTLSTYNESMEN